MNKQRGITLIALVITIIVLLILAAVSIATLTGENGILSKANTAKIETERATAKEKVQIAVMSGFDNSGKLDYTQLKTNLDNVEGIEKSSVLDRITKLPITVKVDGYDVTINEKGNITVGENGGGNIPEKPTLPTTDDTKPYLPDDNTTIISNNPDTGIIIKDSNDNEWVWVEVPKSIYTSTTYNGGTAPTSSQDYDKIESTMQAYTDIDRGSYSDTWYSEETQGLTSDQYTELKQSMLKSVYENGGFYIGRYEAGTDTPRFDKTDPLTTPMIQRDKYPYNFIACPQAQEKVSTQLKVGDKKASLMFGIQWDLILKFLEVKGKLQNGTKITHDMLSSNSGAWGNYKDATFEVKRKEAFYTTSPTTKGSWNNAENYTKPIATALLTTGAVDRNSVLGIYDLAGNVNEWTLEYTAKNTEPIAGRGGCYIIDASGYSAYYRGSANTDNPNALGGFRPALW